MVLPPTKVSAASIQINLIFHLEDAESLFRTERNIVGLFLFLGGELRAH